jgi:hypothetical protein
VDPIRPAVHEVTINQIAAGKRLVIGLPGDKEPINRCRRQPRRRAEEPLQRRHEVTGGQPMQVQQRQHLGHLRALAAPWRQDHRAEPDTLTRHRIGAAIVDPRRPDRDRPGHSGDLPLARVAVAHHQPLAVLVPLGRARSQIVVDLGFQPGGQHPPGTLTHQLVQVKAQLVVCLLGGDYTQHAAFLPRRR